MIAMSEVAHMYKLSMRNGHAETQEALYGLLMFGLGERQKEALTFINANGPVRCLEVAAKLRISRRNTSSLLSTLRTYGLINYKVMGGGYKCGSHYEWYGVIA